MRKLFLCVMLAFFASGTVEAKPKPKAKHTRSPASITNPATNKALRRQLNTLPAKTRKKKRATSSDEPSGLAPPTSEAHVPVGDIFSPINLSAGTNFGLNYLFTTLHFQLALLQHLVIGVMPLYSSSTLGAITANAIGGIATLAWYKKSYFEGFFAQAGVGATSISATSGALSERKTSVIFNVVGGWRIVVIPHLNVCFGAGVQYATDPGLVLVDINFRSFRPVFTVELGYNF